MLIQILSVLILFLLNIYVLFLSPYIEYKRKERYLKRVEESKFKEYYNEYELTFEAFPKKRLISCVGSGELLISNVDIIDIKDKIRPTKLIIDNVKLIKNISLDCDNIDILNSNYTYIDNCIIDKKNNVVEICKDLSKDELIELTEKYSFKRQALKYLSNATYTQISKVNESIRISKPYNENDKPVFLITPKKIENLLIRKIEINFNTVDYLYINDQIEKISLERHSMFKTLKLAKKAKFKVRNRTLVDIKKSMYLHCGAEKFRSVSSENIKGIYYNKKYKLNRIYLNDKVLKKGDL